MILQEQVDAIAKLAVRLEKDHRRMSQDEFHRLMKELTEQILDLQMHFGK